MKLEPMRVFSCKHPLPDVISPFIRILNRGTCISCTWLPFLIGQVCSQLQCSPYLAANFGFFELRTFPWSPRKVKEGTFYSLTLKVAGFQVHLHYTWSSSVKPTNKLTLQSESQRTIHASASFVSEQIVMGPGILRPTRINRRNCVMQHITVAPYSWIYLSTSLI